MRQWGSIAVCIRAVVVAGNKGLEGFGVVTQGRCVSLLYLSVHYNSIKGFSRDLYLFVLSFIVCSTPGINPLFVEGLPRGLLIRCRSGGLLSVAFRQRVCKKYTQTLFLVQEGQGDKIIYFVLFNCRKQAPIIHIICLLPFFRYLVGHSWRV